MDRRDDEKTPFSLLDRSAYRKGQSFVFDDRAGQFHPSGDEGLCIAVGEASRSAGPFMFRDLIVVDFTGTDSKFTRWMIAP